MIRRPLPYRIDASYCTDRDPRSVAGRDAAHVIASNDSVLFDEDRLVIHHQASVSFHCIVPPESAALPSLDRNYTTREIYLL